MPEADPRRALEDMQRMRDQTPPAIEMPRYKCHKEVWALKIKEIKREPYGNAGVEYYIVPEDARYAPINVHPEYIEKHAPKAGGYYVSYTDGYISYSPAKAFEEGYTRI